MKKIFTLLMVALTFQVYAIKLTFKVNMTGQDVSQGVYITGHVTQTAAGDWAIRPMTDEGNGFYSWDTTWTTVGDSLVFYFLTTPSWDNYLDFRETVPTDCDNSMELAGWEGDRALKVPSKDTILYHQFSSCETPLGIEKNNFRNSIHINVFPNPSNGFITIELADISNGANAEIFDISGKMVKEFVIPQKLTNIDLTDLPKSIYLLRITTDEGTISNKIQIK